VENLVIQDSQDQNAPKDNVYKNYSIRKVNSVLTVKAFIKE